MSVWCVWSLEHPHQSRSSNCCCCTRHPFAKQRQRIASIAKDPSHLDEQDLWVPLEKMSKLWRSASHDHFVHPPSSAFHRQESCKPKPVMNFEAHGYPGGLVRRSATHDQFMHPPSHMLRRRPPCKPKERIKFEDPEVPLPLSTHQTSFQNLGIPMKQLICRPKNAFKKETLRDVPGTYNPVSRTTSADAFLQKPLSTREPCMPPTNIASHYTSAEGWRFNQAGTTSSTAYRSLITPTVRESCRPATTSSLPMLYFNETGNQLARTTSSDAFQQVDVRLFKRQSCKPVDTSRRPY